MEDLLISRRDLSNLSDARPPYIHHKYPFSTLGYVRSHAHPHFVIYNTGKKLIDKIEPLDVGVSVEQCMGISYSEALTCLLRIQAIYKFWMGDATSSAPNFTPNGASRSDRDDEGEDRSDGESEDGNRNRHGGGGRTQEMSDVRNITISGGNKDGNADEGGLLNPRQLKSFTLATDTPDLAVDDGETSHESVDSLEECISDDDMAVDVGDLSKWAEGAEGAAMSEGGWEPVVINDRQLGKYAEERARSPRKVPWGTWRPSWMRRGLEDMHKPPPDTTKFSSNDWCLYDYCIALTDDS
jgi:hypothetical protein